MERGLDEDFISEAIGSDISSAADVFSESAFTDAVPADIGRMYLDADFFRLLRRFFAMFD